MRVNMIALSVIINLILVAGIIYLNYFAPLPDGQRVMPGSQKTGLQKVKIAIITATQKRNTMCEIMSGVIDTLKKEARFEPDIKIYDANDNRTLMRSNIDQAIKNESDVLVTFGSQAAQMTKEITEKREAPIPTVFSATGDPIRLELIKNTASSGNHMTGVSIIGFDWIDEMVSLMPTVMPWVKRVFIPYDPNGFAGGNVEYHQRFVRLLERDGYKVSSVEIRETNEIGEKVTPFMDDMDVMLILPDVTVTAGMDHLSKLCEQYSKPIYVGLSLGMLSRGATFGYGFHLYDVGKTAAGLVRQIVEQGRAPSDIPIDQMSKNYRMGVSLENARKQGVLDKIDKSLIFLMENGEVI